MIPDPNRLVLDFPDTVSGSLKNRITVNRNGLKEVRIGVQPITPPTTRVVLDLDEARPYRLVPEGNKLTVALNAEGNSSDPSSPQLSSDAQPTATKAGETSPAERNTETSAASPAELVNFSPAAASSSLPSEPGPASDAHSQPSSKHESSAGWGPFFSVLQAQRLDPMPAFADISAEPTLANPEVKEPPASESTQIFPASGTTNGENSNSGSPESSGEGNGKATGVSNNGLGAPGQSAAVASESRPNANAALLSASAKDNSPADPPEEKPIIVASANATSLPPDPRKIAPDAPAATTKVAPPAAKPSPNDYVIGEQDVLTIIVWKERELSGQVVVRPDGKITLPLVNEIKVVGMTPAQLQLLLTEKFKPFVNIPQVTVEVNQINSRKVYLIGEVQKTGTFPVNSSTTVLEVIAQAGGLRDFAKRKDVYILRNVGGKQTRYPFSYDDVIRGRKTEQNILLQPGDLIVVP
jgi:polysaccharide export outer membrane protein